MNVEKKTSGNESSTLFPASQPDKSNLIVQRKLSIGAENDPLEHEADAMADKVIRMTEPNFIQRKCAECEEEKHVQKKPLTSFIQNKENAGETAVSDTAGSRIESTRGSSHTLNGSVKNFMETSLGNDFSGVKIHTDADAIQLNHELNAKAFTVGSDIYFNEGQYQPGSSEGKKLLLHELTHVLQQKEAARNRSDVMQGNEQISRAPSPAPAPGVFPPPLPPPGLLAFFESLFPDAAGLIRKSTEAMKLVSEAETAKVKFGGYAEIGPAKAAWAYTIGDTVYVPKARTDKFLALSDFLFELNNAIRKPQFAENDRNAVKGTITAKQYARRKVELEVEGMLRLGSTWSEVKKSEGGDKKLDKYDKENFLQIQRDFEAKKKTKDDIINEVLTWMNGIETTKTNEQYYMDQYKGITGGK